MKAKKGREARPAFQRNATVVRNAAVVYDWLAANGVNEWLPENPIVEIDPTAGTIRYTAFVWDGPRGWDADHMRVVGNDVAREWRTVPLLVPPSRDVVAAAARGGMTLSVG